MEKIIVTNIKWDTDGEDIPELPTEVTLDKWTNDEEETLDCIADMLSDLYGCAFCPQFLDQFTFFGIRPGNSQTFG